MLASPDGEHLAQDLEVRAFRVDLERWVVWILGDDAQHVPCAFKFRDALQDLDVALVPDPEKEHAFMSDGLDAGVY